MCWQAHQQFRSFSRDFCTTRKFPRNGPRYTPAPGLPCSEQNPIYRIVHTLSSTIRFSNRPGCFPTITENFSFFHFLHLTKFFFNPAYLRLKKFLTFGICLIYTQIETKCSTIQIVCTMIKTTSILQIYEFLFYIFIFWSVKANFSPAS